MQKSSPSFVSDRSVKPYAHFDKRISYCAVKKSVENPDWVAHHGFFPLISKPIINVKYVDRKQKPKIREVSYASHVDRCVYVRYSYLLNCLYNNLPYRDKLNKCSLAYRTNLGSSNIDFAYDAITAINQMDECYVIVSDFEDFFPSLDHCHLKNAVASMFDEGYIPNDFYNVLKSVLRYSEWSLEDLMARDGLDVNNLSDVRVFNNKKLAISREVFKRDVKKCTVQPGLKLNKGIPQGLPISGVLANIYMIDFDIRIYDCISELGGCYFRYSDDILIAVPTYDAFNECVKRINELCEIYRLRLQKSKTRKYHFKNSCIYEINAGYEEPSKIQYLGFDFDGRSVRLRQSTIGRYYKKMNRRARVTFAQDKKPGKKYVSEYYRLYSLKGSRVKVKRVSASRAHVHGNFITYSNRAFDKFKDSRLDNKVNEDIKNHYLKMRRTAERLSKGRY